MQYRYIGNGMALSKVLKDTAHRVRMEIDHRPVTKDADGKVNNPRKRRLVATQDAEGKLRMVAPELNPYSRHVHCTGGRR